jgi:hypothetical protein
MEKDKPNIIFDGCLFQNNNKVMRIDGDTHVAIRNCDFVDNAHEIDAKNARRIDVENSKFSSPTEPKVQPPSQKPRRFFGGFSFSKGDHLDK